MDQPWLVVTFTPGFSPVRYACRIEVSSSGLLEQRMVRLSEVGQRSLPTSLISARPESVELTCDQLTTLRKAVERVDFKKLSKRLEGERVLDATKLSIEVSPAGAEHIHIGGAIFSGHKGYHDFKSTFEPAQKLWEALYVLLPVAFIDMA